MVHPCLYLLGCTMIFDDFSRAYNARGLYASPHGEALYQAERAADEMWAKIGKGAGTAVKKTGLAAKLLASPAVLALGIGGLAMGAAGILGMGATATVGGGLLHAAWRAGGGLPGIGALAGSTLKGIMENVKSVPMGVERLARSVLIGGGTRRFSPYATSRPNFMRMNALDAWMPFLKDPSVAKDNLMKYSLNPRVVKRLAGLSLAYGVVKSAAAAGQEALFSPASPTTVYFDGTSVRHVDDMGADARYARKVLGRNSRIPS